MCLSCICCCCEILLRSSCGMTLNRTSCTYFVTVLHWGDISGDDSFAGCRLRWFARGVSYPKLYPIFAEYIACELSFTGTLLGRTRPSIECRIQCFDYRASLASTHACFLSCFFGVSRLRGDLAMLLEARRFSSCFSWVSRLRGEASKINVRGSPALAVL